MKIAQITEKARYNARLTLSSASRGIGISVSHLHAIERGEKPRPKMATIHKIAVFYGLNYDNLCLSAERIPQDVFYKITKNPHLLDIIRNLEV